MTQVMIFEEKHGSRYFVINDKVDEAKAALKMLRERSAEGYWYPNKEQLLTEQEEELIRLDKKFEKEIIEMDESEISKLPEVIREKIIEDQAKYEKNKKSIHNHYKYEIEWCSLLEQVLNADEKDALTMVWTSARGVKRNLAKMLLDMRADHQYEGYYVCDAEEF